ncbi:MGDG synthase family glycosyltransferase [Fredinandcohnia sp. 179-A 10B2 NHS]|uniref:MGDG synthase family glycosyltransferase n=1 Tax=Fredinandcohnia sp. 179-A 10B2 NHS TaxID=3235176 RepID=UPI0039A0EEB3
MKKVLFMPFLQLPSGHHQVADAIIDTLRDLDPSLTCEKIDILDYSYGRIEALVSKVYIKWIHLFPNIYSWLYKKSVMKDIDKTKNYRLYELLFIGFVNRLLFETKPHLIVCSHALPSYMLNKLKEKNGLRIPVINVYTDFFIHTFWGLQHIDYHFVAHQKMKTFLIQKGVSEEKIFVTGIPVHPILRKSKKRKVHSPETLTCTIMGGSLGVGAIEELINLLLTTNKITFYILCGKNERLLRKLEKLQHPRITPLPYISSRKEMNQLYEKTDLVITKPGGVTISECLTKQIPIFIYHALPGQEEINLQELLKMGLAVKLPNWKEIKHFENLIFNEIKHVKQIYKNIEEFHNYLTPISPGHIVHKIFSERSSYYGS